MDAQSEQEHVKVEAPDKPATQSNPDVDSSPQSHNPKPARSKARASQAGAPARPDALAADKLEKRKSRRPKNNVRKLRTERMMSKAELARRAGVSTLTVDRVEKGMPCRMDTKRKILEALGLTPQDRVSVFGEEE